MDNKKNEKAQAKPKKKVTQKPNKPTLSITNTVTIGVAGLACVLSIYTLTKLNNNNLMASAVTESLTQQINRISSSQASLKDQLSMADEKIGKVQQSTQQTIDSLEKSIQSTLKQRHFKTNDWLLQKALYYLQMAQITLYWSNDIASSITLLETADKLLAQVNNPKLFDARQAVAKEITQLKSISRPDKPGMLSQLSAISSQLANLPLNKQKFSLPAPNQSSETPSKSHWQKAWNNSLDALKRLVIIRYHNQDIRPILSPLQREMLTENLKLSIQQAQWAVIHEDQKLYDFALGQTLSTINAYFAQNAQETKSLTKQLSNLKSQSITTPKPNISQSQNLLKKFLQQSDSNIALGEKA